MSLFEPSAETAPLAARMRPRKLDDVVGQPHLLAAGSPLRQLIDDATGRAPSVILWGPPGAGKTTLAQIISGTRRFVELSAVNAGVKEVRAVIEAARDRLGMQGSGTVLFVDEVHRFSKTQQDALLPAVENGWITLVAATTENPSFSVIPPLLSRSVLVTLRPLSDDDIRAVLRRALTAPEGLAGVVSLDADAEDHLLRIAGGDARRGLTALEAVAGAARMSGLETASLELVERTLDQAAPRYDTDLHYDVISAYIKSMRGSDADAALHYLARMVKAGEDPRFIARRLMILASEDIGLADVGALPLAVAAAQAVALVGMPEGYYFLAHATIALSLAPKSNAVGRAMSEATADVEAGRVGVVPPPLRDASYAGAARLGHGQAYVYSHDAPGGVAEQQYLPDTLVGRQYYEPRDPRGTEVRYAERYERLREALGGRRSD